MGYYEKLGEISKKNNEIKNKFYHIYKVKRGLRNADGSGVLVGLTTVSQVIGFQKVDEEIRPTAGKLVYRGIDVRDLVKGFETSDCFGFEETVFLLLFGRLPQKDEMQKFNERLGSMRSLDKNFPRDVLQTCRTPDIMNALSRSVLTLYGTDDQADDLSIDNQISQAMNLIAKLNTLVPYAYYAVQQGFHNKSLIIHSPDPNLSSAENFLHLLRPSSEYSDLEAKTLDIALVLHADHGGGNNSTFTARVTSSTSTDIYSSIAAALGSLRGPLHGGANIRVSNMMDDLKKNVKNWSNEDQLRDYLFKCLKGEAFDGAGKIYGVGHAVYTNSDPRAEIFREYARKLSVEKGREEEFALYEQIEKIGPDILREYKNAPNMSVSSNVDFYSGFVYDCLGIPKEVFTPIFAISRVAGWCAHRIEMLTNKEKLMRPSYKSLSQPNVYSPLDER